MVGQSGELIDDRELRGFEEDRFRHADVADQLAELAATVNMPANVALYGPWGSGKTGVSNLLRERFVDDGFRKTSGKVAYAHFDAFKYAEIPLRRHFLSQLAEQLLTKSSAEALRSRLYRSEVHTDIEFTWVMARRALAVFTALLLAGFVFATVLSVIAAGGMELLDDEGGEFAARFRTYFAGVVGFSFAPAAVLGGLFAIAGKSLPVRRSSDAPSSEEQFEDEFGKLLKAILCRHKAERLVVFIDELDRCPPDKVVDVLDTVRTFLDVHGTVFIVAADRHVVERALTERVQQTTPPDATNPYYSSGSAYLDKIFHYQTSLPALMTQRVTKYALELVEGRPGLWTEVDIGWVVSVLVPSHVRSPRRVKTLLNNYVLTFRMARARHRQGQIPDDPSVRSLELAKLVCLRTEFPGFARELTLSRQLPDLFLRACEEPAGGSPPGVAPYVWETAIALATDHIEIDEMLDHPPAQELAQDDDVDRAEGDATEETEHAVDTRAALRQQLRDYLVKTRHVANPRPDLVFLESTGFLFGLDESVAEQLEEAATGGQPETIVALADQQEPEAQTSVVRFLAQQAQQAHPGVEGDNVVGALLQVAGTRSDEVLSPCADVAFDALSAQGRATELSPDDLPGALALGLRSDREGARRLVRSVLDRQEVVENADLGMLAIQHADQLVADHLSRLGQVTAHRVLDRQTAANAIAMLHASDVPGNEVLRASVDELVAALSTASATETEPDGTSAATPMEERRHAFILSLEEALERAQALEARQLTQPLLLASFRADHLDYWKDAGHYLHIAEPIDDPALVDAVLSRAVEADTKQVRDWLQRLPVGVKGDEAAGHLDAVASALWTRRDELGDDYDAHTPELIEAMAEVRRLQSDDAQHQRQDLIADADESIAGSPTSAPTATQANASWSHLRRFGTEGLVAEQAVGGLIADKLTTTLATQPTPPQHSTDESFVAFVETWSLWAAPRCTTDRASALVTALHGSWLPTPRKENLCLQVAAIAARSSSERRAG